MGMGQFLQYPHPDVLNFTSYIHVAWWVHQCVVTFLCVWRVIAGVYIMQMEGSRFNPSCLCRSGKDPWLTSSAQSCDHCAPGMMSSARLHPRCPLWRPMNNSSFEGQQCSGWCDSIPVPIQGDFVQHLSGTVKGPLTRQMDRRENWSAVYAALVIDNTDLNVSVFRLCVLILPPELPFIFNKW